MRASTARLMNSPVRLADLTFPQVNRLIHRTRLAFIHLDNLLAFGKRDRDGRVDGYIAAYLPQQAPNALINTYRELYWRIVDEVDKEFPGEAKRRAQKVSSGIVDAHQAITILSAPRGTDTPDSVVQPEELSNALTDWSLQLLEGVEVMMPGTAPKILREATREHRYVLQSAGYYGRLPWPVAW